MDVMARTSVLMDLADLADLVNNLTDLAGLENVIKDLMIPRTKWFGNCLFCIVQLFVPTEQGV